MSSPHERRLPVPVAASSLTVRVQVPFGFSPMNAPRASSGARGEAVTPVRVGVDLHVSGERRDGGGGDATGGCAVVPPCPGEDVVVATPVVRGERDHGPRRR